MNELMLSDGDDQCEIVKIGQVQTGHQSENTQNNAIWKHPRWFSVTKSGEKERKREIEVQGQ